MKEGWAFALIGPSSIIENIINKKNNIIFFVNRIISLCTFHVDFFFIWGQTTDEILKIRLMLKQARIYDWSEFSNPHVGFSWAYFMGIRFVS